MEVFEKILSEIGIENAGELIQKPDAINAEELVQQIRVTMRAQMTNDSDFTGGYVEQGRQSVYSEFYDELSKNFGVPKEEILNKPLADTLMVAKNKAQSSLSKQSKDYEEMITQLNKRNHELENVIMPQKLQAKEAEITNIRNEYLIKQSLSGYKLQDGINAEVAERFVIAEVFDPTKFKLTRDANGQVLITTPDGKAVRREDRKDMPALDVKGVVGYLLEKGGLLQKQGQPKEHPKTGTNGFAPINTPGNSTTTPPVSQEVIANAQRLAERYGQRR